MKMKMRARIGRLYFDVAGVQGEVALAREENDSPELEAAWGKLQAALDALGEVPEPGELSCEDGYLHKMISASGTAMVLKPGFTGPIATSPLMPCRKCGGYSYKE